MAIRGSRRRTSRRGRGRDEAAGGDGRCAGGRGRASAGSEEADPRHILLSKAKCHRRRLARTGSVVASRYKFHHRYKVHRCVPRESRVLVAPIRFEIGREFAARGPNCHSITADAQRRSRRRCAWPGHWTAVDGCCSRRSPHPPTPSLPPRGSPVSCVALFRRMSRRGRDRDERQTTM